VGHAMLLHRFESPFVAGDSDGSAAQARDLVFAALICAHTFEEAIQGLTTRRFHRLARRGRLQCFLRLRTPEQLRRKIELFREYLAQGSRWPSILAPRDAGSQPGAPWLQRLKLALMIHLGKTESEALNTPLGAAQWDYAAFWEGKAAWQITSDRDLEMFRTARGLEAAEAL